MCLRVQMHLLVVVNDYIIHFSTRNRVLRIYAENGYCCIWLGFLIKNRLHVFPTPNSSSVVACVFIAAIN
jgi:hypothetical protein